LQRVWTSGTLERLKDAVGAGCNKNPVSKMVATGVPPHLVLANRMTDMQNGVDVLRNEIKSKLDDLPEALKQSMLQNFQVGGTVPITHLQVVDMLTNLQASINASIHEAIRAENTPVALAAIHVETSLNGERSDVGNYRSWTWNSRIHPVPQDFRFPK
jgi:hypothetical protein